MIKLAPVVFYFEYDYNLRLTETYFLSKLKSSQLSATILNFIFTIPQVCHTDPKCHRSH